MKERNASGGEAKEEATAPALIEERVNELKLLEYNQGEKTRKATKLKMRERMERKEGTRKDRTYLKHPQPTLDQFPPPPTPQTSASPRVCECGLEAPVWSLRELGLPLWAQGVWPQGVYPSYAPVSRVARRTRRALENLKTSKTHVF